MGQRLPKRRHFLPVAAGHCRMDQRPGLLAALGNDLFQRLQPRGDAFQLVLDEAGGDTLPDRLQDVRTGLPELVALGPGLAEGRILRRPEAVQVACVFLAEDLDQVVPHQVGLEGRQDFALQRLPLDGLAVPADRLALVLGRGAAVVGGIDLGVTPAADPAPDQPREQVTGPVPLPEARRPGVERLLPGFGGVPKVRRDDPQLRERLPDQGGLVIQPGDAAPGRRVLHKPLAVPDELAGIKLIVENAGSPSAVAVDRALAPRLPGGARDALPVELGGNRFRGQVLHRVVFEDAPDDGGLRRVDRAIPPQRLALRIEALHHVVAVGDSAAGLAMFDPAAQTAARLVGKVLEEHRVHRAFQADVKGGDFALGERHHFDARKLHPLVDARNVFLIAAQAVQSFRKDDIERTRKRIADERLDAGAHERRARQSGIAVAFGNLPAFRLRAFRAETELVLNRMIALQIGGITRVERDALA